MKKIHTLTMILLVFLAAFGLRPEPAAAFQAQTDQNLTLSVSKVIGYSSGFGSAQREMQGTFSMTARGPADLQRVEFYIDDQLVGEAVSSPFRIQFRTESHSLGVHNLSAVGYTQSGSVLQSNVMTTTFVTAGAGMQTAMRIIIPIFALIGGVMLLSFVLTMRSGRRKQPVALGASQTYGVSGGAICPRCGRPFPLNFLGINIGPLHKVDRCPHCGKWGPMRRRSMADLRAAEQAELEQEQLAGTETSELTEEERLRRELDASRYQ